MKQLDIQTFHDFSNDEVSRRILMEDPVMRVVLVSMRAGQSLPEHAANGLVTVYSIGGQVLFYEGAEACEVSYADRNGKYMKQMKITLPMA